MVRKPEWLKIRPPAGANYARLKQLFRSLNLHTVCEEAQCPNIGECWGGGTATLMLMGDVCTRGCRFCDVKTGKPGVLDGREPENVGVALGGMDLEYVVLTSVNRDDLPDGGSDHFARTVEVLRREDPDLLVEVLIPDFQGDRKALDRMIAARPHVIAHNLETVESLTPKVRDRRAAYAQSLAVLRYVKEAAPELYTKSSLMLGVGETEAEVEKAMDDLRANGVQILTLGQYLQPSKRHLPVTRFVPPPEFDRLRALGEAKGFLYVAAGPLVRSSYRAGEYFLANRIREGGQPPMRKM